MKKISVLIALFYAGTALSAEMDQSRLLFRLCEKDEIKKVKNLLRTNPSIDINYINRNGKTPLYIAIYNNNFPLIETLLNAGADPNIPRLATGDAYPLFSALYRQYDDFKLLKLLVKHPLINFDVINPLGHTPLDLAINMGSHRAAEILLHAGANPNTPNIVKQTYPLHRACRKKDIKMVEILMNAPTKPALNRREGTLGMSPLEIVQKFPADDPTKEILLNLLTINASATDDQENDMPRKYRKTE